MPVRGPRTGPAARRRWPGTASCHVPDRSRGSERGLTEQRHEMENGASGRRSPPRWLVMAWLAIRRGGAEPEAHAKQPDVPVIALPPADDHGDAARFA